MPSRASTSLLQETGLVMYNCAVQTCQCPLGLMPHCYHDAVPYSTNKHMILCQCPLGLMPHCYGVCPRSRWVHSLVSMPSRANASLLQYPFKNLGFMRFPEPVFEGICQNILTVTHFHAC